MKIFYKHFSIYIHLRWIFLILLIYFQPVKADSEMTWNTQPPSHPLPPGVSCSCIQIFDHPTLPSPHPPFPDEVRYKMKNNCSTPISVFMLHDTIVPNLSIPIDSEAPGRSFGVTTIASGDYLTVNVRGEVGGLFAVTSCPSN